MLARKVARVAMDCRGQINEDPADVPPELNDRAADNWRVLITIADAIDGHWPNTARAAARAAAGTPEPETQVSLLLFDLRDLFEDRGRPTSIPTREILAALSEVPERRWLTWCGGKPITDEALANMLKEFEVHSERLGGRASRAMSYTLKSLQPVFDRYLPDQSCDPVWRVTL